MARSIDLRRELLRGIQRWQTPLPCKGLTSQTPSRQRSSRSVPNRPHIWAQAIPIEPSKALQAGGRPHMDARFRGHDDKGTSPYVIAPATQQLPGYVDSAGPLWQFRFVPVVACSPDVLRGFPCHSVAWGEAL